MKLARRRTTADNDTGAFIWYELMTRNPDAARTFYDAVIGWRLASRDVGEGNMNYRIIRRTDSVMEGCVLARSQEVQDGGVWPA